MEELAAELLVAVLVHLDTRSLVRLCCTSRAVRKAAMSDEAWRPQLLTQGVTEAGMALWQQGRLGGGGSDRATTDATPRLIHLFLFADRYHEAIEFEVLSHRRQGSFNACLEFANVFHTSVWTFFATQAWPASAEGDDTEHVHLHASAAGAACCAEGFAVAGDVGRGEVVLLHFAAGAARSFPALPHGVSTAYHTPRHPDHLQALCLLPGSHAQKLVTIGEHGGLGFDQGAAEPSFCLHVVQATNVCLNGSPIECAAGHDLSSSHGAIVPTTRETPTVDTGVDFDWGRRRYRGDGPQQTGGLHDTNANEQQQQCATWGGLPDMLASAPESDHPRQPVLSYTVIRRSRAFRSVFEPS
jgi:hypothetical protein